LPYGEESVLSCEGLPNLGAVGTANEVKRAKALDPRFLFVPNISASSEKEFVEMAKLLEDAGADALELAIKGCPNYMGDTKMAEGYWNEDPGKAFHLVKAVRKAVKIPLWIKGSNEADFVLAYEEAGADAVLMRYRSIHAMPLNPVTGKPLLSDPRGMANFHGPYAKFPGVKLVADISRGVKIPIIGNGGITCGQDVIDYVRAGASAVQLLTIIIRKGMPVVARILSEVETYLKSHGHKSIEEIRGDVLQYLRI
jgi:dihydroorotate dehydrogenase